MVKKIQKEQQHNMIFHYNKAVWYLIMGRSPDKKPWPWWTKMKQMAAMVIHPQQWESKHDGYISRCSMYGIFTNINPQNHPNVGKYTIHGAYGISIPMEMGGMTNLPFLGQQTMFWPWHMSLRNWFLLGKLKVMKQIQLKSVFLYDVQTWSIFSTWFHKNRIFSPQKP